MPLAAMSTSSFANSFWSGDYAAGLGVLFAKLQQGVQENEQLLTVARMRAEAEDAYGQRLGDIEAATNRIDGGFQRDDGASVKKVSIPRGVAGIAVRLMSGVGIRGGEVGDELRSFQSPQDSFQHP